ncbi:MAG: hypothetical protein HKP51_00300 [Sulfitobacter sp.]|nr:hypothetical protein [Sulfitobacter sp.]
MGKMDKIKAATKTEDAKVVRARRMEAMAKASTVTFTLEPAVHRFMEAQAKAAEMNLTHYMQKLVETHVIDAAPKNDPLAMRLAGKRHVINHALKTATQLDAAGKFDEHFILTVIKEAEKDGEFAKQYAAALGGKDAEGTKAGERQRVSLNQQVGRVIKKAVGARSKRNENGKIARAQVTGSIISTYTLLEKPS